MTVQTGDLQLFGWRLRSELPLPDLLPWTGAAADDRPPDVWVTIGPVPDLEDARPLGPAIRIADDGKVRVEVPGVATYLITGDSQVTVAPALPVDAPDIRIFMLTTVLAVLCYRRGFIPLHAAAVAVEGRALLLAGESGLGKSTLAATLAARGYPLLTDDLCALDCADPARPMIRPAYPRLRLWQDTANHLSIPTDGLEQCRTQLRKFILPVAETAFHAAPLPPAHLVVLRRAHLPSAAGVARLTGMRVLTRRDMVHRWRLGEALGHGPATFTALGHLARAIPVTEITRIDDLDGLPALADSVLRLLESAAA